jgi:putative tryptophan/tyrosine transport system substrate-binding protein
VAATLAELAGKLVHVVHELMPAARRIAALANVLDLLKAIFCSGSRATGAAAGGMIDPVMIHSSAEHDAASSALDKEPSNALIVQPVCRSGGLPNWRIATGCRRPAESFVRDFAGRGGLLNYGSDEADA